MIFNPHTNLVGKHAVLSASKYHWINYSPERMVESYRASQAAAHGTRLHEFASEAIRLGIKMPRNKKTLNAYINDAIGFRMQPEQILYYSDLCFGTADAISFDAQKSFLRIHDLKTGLIPAKPDQLEVYAAMFCLEYRYKPHDIQTELRIYQNDEVLVHIPEKEKLIHIMDRIVYFDKLLKNIQSED